MRSMQLVFLAVSLIFSATCGDRIRYDNYHAYQVFPRIFEHLQYLQNLESRSDSIILLSEISSTDKAVSILVAPHKIPDFIENLDDSEIPYELVERNFQKILDAELEDMKTKVVDYDWRGYHTLNETYDWLRDLEKEMSSVVKTIVAGTSYEGREILGVKVSCKEGNKGIFIEGGIHAREWISPATVTFILNELLTSKDPYIREVAEQYDWYIFPHVNPDGFVFTHSTDRLWRKTRSKGQTCYGADPNRNWDFNWMVIGASSDECSNSFAGKTPFSEIEMKSISDYVISLKGKLSAYLAFHSHGQLMLYPYGHTAEPSENDNHLAQIANAATQALASRFKTQYTYGSTYLAIYPAAGTSPDWAYGTQSIKVAYTYELRPKSSINGFVLPSSQIIPTGHETMDSLLALTIEAKKLGYL